MSLLDYTTDAGNFALPLAVPPRRPTPKRWSREDYYQLAEQGWFQDQRVELIDGEIIQLPPQSFGRSYSVDAIFHLLLAIFPSGYWVRPQLPLVGGQFAETEPDVAVIRGDRETHSEHPRTAALVVEVSLSSLDYDRITKASLYASIGVPDYWLLDLERRVLELRRQPVKDAGQRFGWRYDEEQTIDQSGSVSPLEKPEASVAVVDMLPLVTA